MSDFSKVTDEDLKPWLDGTNAQIGSAAYVQAKAEQDKRIFERSLQTLMAVIQSLSENWKTKMFWLVFVAILVGIFVNVLSELIVSCIFS